ncbi:hypothetical protein [Clostridium massiliamazoniense]|uniref:hypothetical protein n=1 Tax=Clostridium massiliamazoniense TaxID=1347366 RepID=UPI0006D843FA|nr:hypothetical protein [Clostridium massiliamazoniense]
MKGKRILIILSCVLVIRTLGCVEYAMSKSNLKKGEEIKKEYSKISYKNLSNTIKELNENLKLNVGKLQGESFSAIENVYEYNFEHAIIGLDYLTGEVRFFKTKDSFLEKQYNSNLNKEDIKERINRYYNILINKSNYKVSESIREEEDFIIFSLNLKLKESIISSYNSLKVTIDKKLKSIIGIDFINNDISNNMNEINISKEEAEKIVRKFVLVNGDEYCENIYLGVVPANKEYENYKSRIAWVAEIEDKKNNKSFVHIDGTDGIVIGRDLDKF